MHVYPAVRDAMTSFKDKLRWSPEVDDNNFKIAMIEVNDVLRRTFKPDFSDILIDTIGKP